MEPKNPTQKEQEKEIMVHYWKNKLTGKKYHEGSKAVKVKRYFKRNKKTGEKVYYHTSSGVRYERKGLFGKRTVKDTSHRSFPLRVHPRLWESKTYDWRTNSDPNWKRKHYN